MKIIIGILIIGLSLQVGAADQSGNYAIWGKGQKSCFRYLKERAGGMDQAYREYVMGYLTAYNAVAPETYSISRDMNLDQIMTWLDDYCDANQVNGLEQSLLQFINNHYEQRYRMPPSRIGR